jgi:hypothetical protein
MLTNEMSWLNKNCVNNIIKTQDDVDKKKRSNKIFSTSRRINYIKTQRDSACDLETFKPTTRIGLKK